ncbi:hypothetical protein VP01_2544g1 [Puccinia sorghi]|uniref:Uncharacterized protein n=1 Tax=Puccinia sorghi TaxID=27349 RepID=A0A0L6V5W2_9BASI|nr:hypothetical protein VP01_2544g1 [Puccinia sorghi]
MPLDATHKTHLKTSHRSSLLNHQADCQNLILRIPSQVNFMSIISPSYPDNGCQFGYQEMSIEFNFVESGDDQSSSSVGNIGMSYTCCKDDIKKWREYIWIVFKVSLKEKEWNKGLQRVLLGRGGKKGNLIFWGLVSRGVFKPRKITWIRISRGVSQYNSSCGRKSFHKCTGYLKMVSEDSLALILYLVESTDSDTDNKLVKIAIGIKGAHFKSVNEASEKKSESSTISSNISDISILTLFSIANISINVFKRVLIFYFLIKIGEFNNFALIFYEKERPFLGVNFYVLSLAVYKSDAWCSHELSSGKTAMFLFIYFLVECKLLIRLLIVSSQLFFYFFD